MQINKKSANKFSDCIKTSVGLCSENAQSQEFSEPK